jgi:predicted acylesterase/phospholipase RssA
MEGRGQEGEGEKKKKGSADGSGKKQEGEGEGLAQWGEFHRSLFDTSTYVVMGGGAMYGVMYIGVLMQLCGHDKTRYLRWVGAVEAVAGTSAGAIIGLLVAAGLTPWDMQHVINTCGLARVMKGMFDLEPAAIAETLALTSGAAVEQVCKEVVETVTGSRDTTLAQFFKSTGRRFVCVVTNLDTQSPEFWDHVSEPDMPLWLAVRATTSLPGIFPVVSLPDGRKVIDGGIVCNLPCIFPPQNTLTLLVQNYKAPGAPAPGLLLNVVGTQMEAAQTGCMRMQPSLYMRCVPCPYPRHPPPLGRLAFGASPSDILDLVNEGKRAAVGVLARDVFIVALAMYICGVDCVSRVGKPAGPGGSRVKSI